ncbi:MAG: hypothetical protein C5B53_10895 [Candidatus Melainabacteria bacterium]|nr:MAG: hypothetical protein C5B53_10895 [Candidatus Melainabacteria bacterium]
MIRTRFHIGRLIFPMTIKATVNLGLSVLVFGFCLVFWNSTSAAFGQGPGNEIPLPGATSVYQTTGDATWGKTGQAANQAGVKSLYQFLPITQEDAKARIDELKTLMLVNRPQDLQGRVNNLCEWLGDLTDAHNKMANAFSRQDSTKAMAQAERSAAQRFYQLKNETVLLKAELLIKLNRTPEALAPLVDIVIADPKGAVGQAAYRHLKELGFSPDTADGAGAISAASQQQEHIMVFPTGPAPVAKKSAAAPSSKSNHPTR